MASKIVGNGISLGLTGCLSLTAGIPLRTSSFHQQVYQFSATILESILHLHVQLYWTGNSYRIQVNKRFCQQIPTSPHGNNMYKQLAVNQSNRGHMCDCLHYFNKFIARKTTSLIRQPCKVSSWGVNQNADTFYVHQTQHFTARLYLDLSYKRLISSRFEFCVFSKINLHDLCQSG